VPSWRGRNIRRCIRRCRLPGQEDCIPDIPHECGGLRSVKQLDRLCVGVIHVSKMLGRRIKVQFGQAPISMRQMRSFRLARCCHWCTRRAK
jgi:hypothetical protein